MDETAVFAITRPHPRLLAYYCVRALLLPLRLIALPYDYFRYHTMRYAFDGEGIGMSWGVLFRREIHLTYARIQDIHVTSSFVQRWFGLADLQLQTASGSSGPEMTIEGVLDVEGLRDFLYSRMRGARGARLAATATPATAALASALAEVASELRRAREAIERLEQR